MLWKAKTAKETRITNAMKALTGVVKDTGVLQMRLKGGLLAGVGKPMGLRDP